MGETDGIVSHDAIAVGAGHNGLTAAAYVIGASGHNAAMRVLADRRRAALRRHAGWLRPRLT